MGELNFFLGLDKGYFLGYSMSSKAFRVFNKRTKRVEENLHVDFLENKPIDKGTGLNWLSDIDSLTNTMNYVPVVVAGTNPTNYSCTKEAAGQDVKKDVSSLRYNVLPNWLHKTHLETSTSNAQDACNANALDSSGISNPTATSTNPLADHMEKLAVETLIPTVSSPVLTDCLNDSPEPSMYVMEPPGFQDPEFLAKVYKVEKAMYRLHQAPRAWYGTLSKYLLINGFEKGTIDQTLFIRRQRGDFILVQVYVDDIIFGSSNPQLCREFEALMH
nr:putative ribonuclease H-like domain-containing protein [Tanacetum cinerariifolium]